MSKLLELIKEFEPKPTHKQLQLIRKIEHELVIEFTGTSLTDASNFISEYLPCMSRVVYKRSYSNSYSYGGGYTNYDESDLDLATSGFDIIDFY